MKTSLLLLFLILPSLSFATSNVQDIWSNNQAVDQLTQKKVLEAHDSFTQLLSKEPFHPVFQFNMAFSFIAIEDLEKATKMHNQILKLNPLPPEVEYATYYNLGFLYAVAKNVDKALENYQKALRFNPESKEIKTNIELLFKQGQGGGKGDKNKKDKNQQNKDKKDNQEQEPKEFTNKKQQPDQFKSKDMSKNDVKKILNELKKQEQRIRAKHERKGKREADREKSW